MVQVGSQKYRIFIFKKLLSHLACSQIWLIYLPMDHGHFGYNKKLPPKTLNLSAGGGQICSLSKSNIRTQSSL
jgi:hypothetical protein